MKLKDLIRELCRQQNIPFAIYEIMVAKRTIGFLEEVEGITFPNDGEVEKTLTGFLKPVIDLIAHVEWKLPDALELEDDGWLPAWNYALLCVESWYEITAAEEEEEKAEEGLFCPGCGEEVTEDECAVMVNRETGNEEPVCSECRLLRNDTWDDWIAPAPQD